MTAAMIIWLKRRSMWYYGGRHRRLLDVSARPDCGQHYDRGLDHVALLGVHSLAALQQRAGLISKCSPLVTGRIEPEALRKVTSKDSSSKHPTMFMGGLISSAGRDSRRAHF